MISTCIHWAGSARQLYLPFYPDCLSRYLEVLLVGHAGWETAWNVLLFPGYHQLGVGRVSWSLFAWQSRKTTQCSIGQAGKRLPCFYTGNACIINPAVIIVTLLKIKDITTHLLHHIVDGIKWFGPVYSTWMYSFERFNSWLCKRALNRFRSEATIMETYRVSLD